MIVCFGLSGFTTTDTVLLSANAAPLEAQFARHGLHTNAVLEIVQELAHVDGAAGSGECALAVDFSALPLALECAAVRLEELPEAMRIAAHELPLVARTVRPEAHAVAGGLLAQHAAKVRGPIGQAQVLLAKQLGDTP